MQRFTKPQRENIKSVYRSYHETWTKAHEALLQQAERHLVACRRRLESAQGEHGRIKDMKPPIDACEEELS